MTEVVLRASGYTWKCPECGRENYTGPALVSVRCRACHGEFGVKELHHRRAAMETINRKEVTKDLPLFSAAPPLSADDEIPF